MTTLKSLKVKGTKAIDYYELAQWNFVSETYSFQTSLYEKLKQVLKKNKFVSTSG